MEEEIAILRAVEKQGEGLYIPGETIDGVKITQRSSNRFEREEAREQIKLIQMRMEHVEGRVKNPLDKIKSLKKLQKKLVGGERTIDADIDAMKAQLEIDYLEAIIGLDVRVATPLEQMSTLRREKVRLAGEIENAGINQKAISKLEAQERRIDNAIEHTKQIYSKDYLEGERAYLAGRIYKDGLRANSPRINELGEQMRNLDKQKKELISKKAPQPEIDKIQKERDQLLQESITIRGDIYDAVEALTFPDMKFGRDPTLSDFYNIAHSRGFIGKAFEKALTAKTGNMYADFVLTVVRTPFKLFDPSMAMHDDPVGRIFLAYTKAVNWGKTKDMAVANRLLQFGEMP
ncbi:MAG: hypothetical protein QQN63_13750, partial [Nitrosopumilus sp.]